MGEMCALRASVELLKGRYSYFTGDSIASVLEFFLLSFETHPRLHFVGGIVLRLKMTQSQMKCFDNTWSPQAPAETHSPSAPYSSLESVMR